MEESYPGGNYDMLIYMTRKIHKCKTKENSEQFTVGFTLYIPELLKHIVQPLLIFNRKKN